MNQNYINEIAESLSESHATLMVGSGFSKNADKVTVTDKMFLNWNELSDLFYHTLYMENDGPGKEYNNPLSLAQEVEVTVGRPKLEKLIKEAVPDMEYAPSKLYINLMELPWKDVFTTNYDTLLERAADQVTRRRYNIVTCQEDLINSNDAPRIVKLHGSFPSHRPFIITEEDYRTYPVEFAAMVNTVQQALLENVFCMIGFSGEDPNFIKWVGWIHDNLGKSSSQKIYMVAVSHISEAKRKLFFERNIVIIDLQELWPDESISTRLEYFVEELKKRVNIRKKKDNWFDLRETLNGSALTQLKDKTELLKKLNNTYPGWIFLPWRMKEKAQCILIESSDYNEIFDVEYKEQLNYMYEYVRFMEIIGRPLISETVDNYWKILKDHENYKCNSPELKEYQFKEQLVYLQLLRAFREQARWSEYELCVKKINLELLDYDSKQFFCACQCWKNLFKFEAEELENTLEKWELVEGDVYWPLIKANFYVLLGEVSKANQILSSALILIRRQLMKNGGNEYLSSIEESIVSVLNCMGIDTENYELCIHENDISWMQENEKYCLRLQKFESIRQGEIDNYNLTTTYTQYWSNEETSLDYAMEYLRFSENTGNPFRIGYVVNTKGLYNTINNLALYYPHWCFMEILIAQDTKHLDVLFGRAKLYSLSQEESDDIGEEYLHILQVVIKNVKVPNKKLMQSLYDHTAIVLPRIISRFCYKFSVYMLDRILEQALQICSSEIKMKFAGIQDLLKGLLTSYTVQQREERLEKFSYIPSIVDSDQRYFEAFYYIAKPKKKYKLDVEIYNKILSEVENALKCTQNLKQNWAINRLVILDQIIELKEKDKSRLYAQLGKKESIVNKYILYCLDPKKYYTNVNYICDKTFYQMSMDLNTQLMLESDHNYEYLLKCISYVDIEQIDLHKSFSILRQLAEKIVVSYENDRINKKKLDQSFLIAVDLLMLIKRENRTLTEESIQEVKIFFETIKNIKGYFSVTSIIQEVFLSEREELPLYLKKQLWLNKPEEWKLYVQLFLNLYKNEFKFNCSEKLMNLVSEIFKVTLYKINSSEILSIKYVLQICEVLIRSNVQISEETISLLDICLIKLRTETYVDETETESNAIYKLKCRIITCKIAQQLFKKGIQLNSIEDWKNISEDKNEFSEIRQVVFEK